MEDVILNTNDSIDIVITRYSNMIYKLALVQTKNKADADDVFQEVFLRYAKNKKPFNNEEHRKAWLIRVTINCSRKLLYSAWFRHTVPLNENLKFKTEEKNDAFYAVLELPLKYRRVIHLFYYNDLTINQIAEILNIKTSTVKSQLFRARQILKEKLKGDFDYE